MILRQYTSKEQKIKEYGTIDTSYAYVRDTNNKIRYLFFKLTFEDLDKYVELFKLRFILNYYKIENIESMIVYRTNLTTIDQSTIEEYVENLEVTHFPTSKEYIFEDTIGTAEAIHSAIFDLNELNININNENNTFVFFVKFNFDIDLSLGFQIMNNNLSYLAEAIFIKENKGLTQMSKLDVFKIDEDSQILISNQKAELFTMLNLVTSTGKSNPINLSITSHHEDIFPKYYFPKYIRFTFQNKIETINFSNNKKVIYITNAYNDVCRYESMGDIEERPANKLIKYHEGDVGGVYFNEIDNTYLYYDENNEYFKIYDKYDNCCSYKNTNNITQLLQIKTKDNKITDYYWEEDLLYSIQNSEGDLILLEYDENNYLQSVLDYQTMRKVNISYN